MDHRRKHAGHRYLAEVDHEVGDAKLSSSHTPGTYRRSRLSAVALLSLGLLVLFVAIVILFHFSHVNKLESVPVKGATKQSVVLRRQDRERGADAQAARTAGVGGSYQEVSEGGLGDDDDDGAANDLPGDEGDGDDDGSANDEPIDKGEKDDDGSANDEPIDKGEKDDDGSANDEPVDKGGKDDDGSANDEPIDKGEKDDDGSANDEPIDKGEKDDDGSANDEPVDKGGKDDDGSANDEPIDKGEKDDDGSANDEPIDKGEKDDDGSANDEPIDKGEKDDDGSANDEPIDKGEKDEDEADGDTLAAASAGDGDNDDDGTQNDTPGNLDEDDDTEQDGHNTTVTTAASGGSGGGKAGTDHSGGIAHEDSTDPEVVDGITDYDDDGWDDLYVEVESGAEEDYEGDQDLVSDPAQKLLLEKHQQHQEEQQPKEMHQQQEQEQKQQQEKAKAERQAESKSASLDSNTAAAAGDPTAAAAQGADMSCGSLSRELLSQWAQNNTVLLTFTNSIMFHNFGATWLYHVRKAGIKYWVLAVADNETAKMVRSAGVDHCFVVHENEIDNTAAAFKWGSRSWQLHTWQKVLTVRHVHHLGFNVINSDLDVVWLRNPLEHFLVKYPVPDYWVSMDPITTANPIGDDGPEVGVSTHHYMNTGVYFLRQNPGGRALIDKWYDIRGKMQQSGFHDQDGLYQYLKDSGQDVDHVHRVTKVVDGKTKLAQLPATLFQNGYSHCINRIHKVHGLKPFEVHFVWVWSGNAGKINRMREQMYYIDPPSYYSDGYFLSFDLDPIETPPGFNNWTDTEAMVQTHLTAMDSQLMDTWHGLALAALLKRIVILPKMKCFCIQNWFENPQCRLPGEPHTRFPLSPACPADYVFNLDALNTFNLSGHHVDHREFSFLDNERTPAEVKDRPLVVVASHDVTTASRNGDTLTIPADLKSDPLLDVLEPFLELPTVTASKESQKQKPPKRLHFRNPRQAFGGWSDPRVGQEFELHVESLPVRWCCRPDAVAKQHGVQVHHQLRMHQALPGAEGADRGGSDISGNSRGRSRRRLRLSALS